ncbi:MAG TPA: nuclear transport factor 2 family protein [Bacteroidia bacterium]|nr:nuclear transport factor 2 family protein [Bacteroidia bacterium]
MITVILFSCNQTAPMSESSSVDPAFADTLMNRWNQAWNSHDSTYVFNLFDQHSVVVFSSSATMAGADIINANWIGKNLPMVANLKTEKINAYNTDDMAYYAGSYTLDIIQNDSVVDSDAGIYTTIWKLNENKEWKIDLMFFGVLVK